MSVKRALVVDDSKSARAFLVRLLERVDIEVDVAESADDALAYLELHRPDVVFMDHLMPGMDGFQGLQAIKRNPRTAAIPVFMYTSQEGELYAGQALALGAAGVLPKQLDMTDLARILRDVSSAPAVTPASLLAQAVPRMSAIVPEPEVPVMPAAPTVPAVVSPRRPSPPRPAPVAPPPVPPPSAPNAELVALRAELQDLRRMMAARLEEQSRRLTEDIVQLVGQVQPAVAEPVPPTRDWRGTLYALLATAAAIALAVLWLRGEVDRRSLEMQVAQLSATRSALVAESPTASPAEAAHAAALPGSPVVLPVPYGEPPLSGVRVERLKELLGQLAGTGFQGVVDVQAYPGRFCLKAGATEVYTLAPDATPVARCEFAVAAGGEAALREHPQFVAMVEEFRKSHGDAITLSVTSGPSEQVQRPYPETGLGVATAADWNVAAAQNSRVEIRWRSRS